MTKLKTSHIVETVVWLLIVIVFFVYSFEFNQEIEIYIFGATGWPRVILGILLLVTLGNFLHPTKKAQRPNMAGLVFPIKRKLFPMTVLVQYKN